VLFAAARSPPRDVRPFTSPRRHRRGFFFWRSRTGNGPSSAILWRIGLDEDPSGLNHAADRIVVAGRCFIHQPGRQA